MAKPSQAEAASGLWLENAIMGGMIGLWLTQIGMLTYLVWLSHLPLEWHQLWISLKKN